MAKSALLPHPLGTPGSGLDFASVICVEVGGQPSTLEYRVGHCLKDQAIGVPLGSVVIC